MDGEGTAMPHTAPPRRPDRSAAASIGGPRSLRSAPKIASGRAADVFDLGDGLVARRYRAHHRAEREAAVMEHARAHGFPAPAVHDARGRVLIMEHVPGSTMLDDLLARPWRAASHGRTLARLHRDLHAIDAPAGVASPFDDGRSLLHLDLHPGNVLLGPDGPVVIDWSNAARGSGDYDVAYTWLLLAAGAVAVERWGGARVWTARRLCLSAFLGLAGRAAAATRLAQVRQRFDADRNITDGERDAVDRLVRRQSK
jgi:aminoglycoside phosphotransferase (APT) family kinase protein